MSKPIAADRRFLRLSGLAGILGAICWTTGDALLIGARARPSDYPLLLTDYAGQIDFGGLSYMLPISEPRLAAGALVAALSIPLYLAGSWHFYRATRPAGAIATAALLTLLICGNAFSPLGHAAFYFVGMLYKTILLVPVEAHPALLALGNRFDRVLSLAYFPAVTCLFLGMALLGLIIAWGRSLYPRWLALILNPISLLAFGHFIRFLLPDPLQTWLIGAGINLGFLLGYALSTFWLWQDRLRPGDGVFA
jgi:hypothetical protein